MNNHIYRITLLSILFFSTSIQATDVVFGGREGNPYYLDLLKHALSYFPNKNYHVIQYREPTPKKRLFKALAENKNINVMTGSSTAERESEFNAIYFPILKGLKGWRLPIISAKNPTLFENIKTIQDFKQLTPVQYHTWTATSIFEHNNINVTKGSNFKGLFLMLEQKRVDYLPRSLLDVQRDLMRYSSLNIMLDSHVLIKYPSAYYFYVNKQNTSLSNDIKLGLEMSLRDGSFDALFKHAFGDLIEQYNLNTRQVFELENPLLLETTPLERSELWAESLLK